MEVTGVLVVYTVFCCRQISVPEKPTGPDDPE